ncbi:MAG: GNAT family N-acetyltransferase [Candidatus Latescibacterota bacterium]|jgi:predicted GNAT family acetyltransferase
MAAASADSEALWQVGVDVVLPWQRRGLGTCLVAQVSRQVLAHGRVPFYTTGVANLLSQRLAVRVGYRPRWTELSVRDLSAQVNG